MKHCLAAILGIILLSSLCFGAERPELKDQRDRESYSLGYQFGKNMKSQGVDLNLDVYASAIRDALTDASPQLSVEEIRKTISEIQSRVMLAHQKELKETGEKNLALGKAFMEANAKKQGVKTLPSGLQYKVLAEGSGSSPKPADDVTVNYRGTLIDGTEFDSSYMRGQPATFKIAAVIPGWKEALQSMKKGSRWQLFIPPGLAYGERDMGRIPPNSTLIFEVELIAIK
jgi:FKBP-type peptidyl-prolyl cis-trans isomerase FklB